MATLPNQNRRQKSDPETASNVTTDQWESDHPPGLRTILRQWQRCYCQLKDPRSAITKLRRKLNSPPVQTPPFRHSPAPSLSAYSSSSKDIAIELAPVGPFLAGSLHDLTVDVTLPADRDDDGLSTYSSNRDDTPPAFDVDSTDNPNTALSTETEVEQSSQTLRESHSGEERQSREIFNRPGGPEVPTVLPTTTPLDVSESYCSSPVQPPLSSSPFPDKNDCGPESGLASVDGESQRAPQHQLQHLGVDIGVPARHFPYTGSDSGPVEPGNLNRHASGEVDGELGISDPIRRLEIGTPAPEDCVHATTELSDVKESRGSSLVRSADRSTSPSPFQHQTKSASESESESELAPVDGKNQRRPQDYLRNLAADNDVPVYYFSHTGTDSGGLGTGNLKQHICVQDSGGHGQHERDGQHEGDPENKRRKISDTPPNNSTDIVCVIWANNPDGASKLCRNYSAVSVSRMKADHLMKQHRRDHLPRVSNAQMLTDGRENAEIENFNRLYRKYYPNTEDTLPVSPFCRDRERVIDQRRREAAIHPRRPGAQPRAPDIIQDVTMSTEPANIQDGTMSTEPAPGLSLSEQIRQLQSTVSRIEMRLKEEQIETRRWQSHIERLLNDLHQQSNRPTSLQHSALNGPPRADADDRQSWQTALQRSSMDPHAFTALARANGDPLTPAMSADWDRNSAQTSSIHESEVPLPSTTPCPYFIGDADREDWHSGVARSDGEFDTLDLDTI